MLRFFTINTDAELVCFLIALMCLVKDKAVIWRWIILFLALTISVEMVGIYLKKPYLDYLNKLENARKLHIHLNIDLVHSNIWIYNILLVFQAVFISLIFQYLLKKHTNSKPLIVTGLVVLCVLYVYEVAVHGIFEKHNITTITMSVMFIIYSLYCYYCLLKEEAYHNLSIFAPFWLVTGILFFYFGRIASLLFFQILETYDPKVVITYPIYSTLIIILYGCWSYSFICRRWLMKRSEI